MYHLENSIRVRHTTDYYVALFTNGLINDYLMHAHFKKMYPKFKRKERISFNMMIDIDYEESKWERQSTDVLIWNMDIR